MATTRKAPSVNSRAATYPIFDAHHPMDKIIRREFTGSWLLFGALALTGIGLPFAVLYLINSTVEIHTEVKNGEEAFDQIRRRS